MKKKLTKTAIKEFETKPSRYDVHDTEMENFFLRVEPSGNKTTTSPYTCRAVNAAIEKSVPRWNLPLPKGVSLPYDIKTP